MLFYDRNPFKSKHKTISKMSVKINLDLNKRVFARDFILGEMKYFQFGVWLIFYNCVHKMPQNETHCVFYFNAVILI